MGNRSDFIALCARGLRRVKRRSAKRRGKKSKGLKSPRCRTIAHNPKTKNVYTNIGKGQGLEFFKHVLRLLLDKLNANVGIE